MDEKEDSGPNISAWCNQLLHGDALTVLRTLPGRCIQVCCTSPAYYKLRSYLPVTAPEKHLEIGTEETPHAYVTHLVEVFREVYRVLKDDGICFLNIGDTYVNVAHGRVPGLPEKSLLGIPWMLTFALREDGWLLRQEIIWEKPNVLPEPVEDRCTKSHEQVFLLTKRPHYFYDADAIREPHQSGMHDVGSTWPTRKAQGSPTRYGTSDLARQSSAWMGKHPLGRNKRSVWRIPTEASADGHYAVMPRKLCRMTGLMADF